MNTAQRYCYLMEWQNLTAFFFIRSTKKKRIARHKRRKPLSSRAAVSFFACSLRCTLNQLINLKLILIYAMLFFLTSLKLRLCCGYSFFNVHVCY